MSTVFTSIATIAALAVNISLASPSPLNAAPQYELRHALTSGIGLFGSESAVDRLRGRKRRTPADFVRQFDGTGTFAPTS